MKGVIFSTSFFIMIFVVFINLGLFVHFDHNRSLINSAFKKSLSQTGTILKDDEDFDEEKVMSILIDDIEPNLPKGFQYTFSLVGYHESPLLIRVKVSAKSVQNYYSITVEETLIEKEFDDAKE